MNKSILTIFFGVFLIGMFSLALGVAEDKAQREARQTIEPQGNMTFGNCVSAGAELKNTCYATVKTTKEACKTVALNQTESKTALKKCNTDYKKDKKQCKVEFKNSKNECKKIKHNVFESMGATFK